LLNFDSNNPAYFTNEKLINECGIRKFIARAVPVKVTDERCINNLKKLIGANL